MKRTDEILHPRGETLPKRRSPDRHSHLLKHNQKYAGPQRRAMNPSRGPQVVAHQQEQKRVATHRSEEHTSELQSRGHLVCRLLLEKKKQQSSQSATRETLE